MIQLENILLKTFNLRKSNCICLSARQGKGPPEAGKG